MYIRHNKEHLHLRDVYSLHFGKESIHASVFQLCVSTGVLSLPSTQVTRHGNSLDWMLVHCGVNTVTHYGQFNMLLDCEREPGHLEKTAGNAERTWKTPCVQIQETESSPEPQGCEATVRPAKLPLVTNITSNDNTLTTTF